MAEYGCAFAATLIARRFGCAQAKHVTARGGPDVVCTDRGAQGDCRTLFANLKAATLPGLGFEDDLLSTPHGVVVKVQYGGLLGLLFMLFFSSSALAAADCYRGTLDEQYCDRNRDLVADLPLDPKNWVDPLEYPVLPSIRTGL